MKKQFENIDDLFFSKINNLDDFDVEINEHLIWKDIESQLDNKKSIRILWWKYASAACVFLLLGFGYFHFNKKEISTTDLVTKKPIHISVNPILNDILISNKLINNTNQIPDNQLVKNKDIKEKFVKSNRKKDISTFQNIAIIHKDLSMIEPLKSVNIQNTEIAFNTTEIKPVEVLSPKKLRVMHIEDFQVQPIDRINQPKVFYVFFNKEFNINNQLPTASITHLSNIN
jgi:hypothetical protein